MIGPAQVKLLQSDWLEDLGHLTEKQFLSAVANYRRKNRFFPCTADILGSHAELEAMKPRKPHLQMLPPPPTSELRDRNARNCKKIRGMIRNIGNGGQDVA